MNQPAGREARKRAKSAFVLRRAFSRGAKDGPETDDHGPLDIGPAERLRLITAASAAVVAAVAAGAALYFGKPIFLPMSAAAALAVLLAPAVDWLRRRGVPNALSAPIVVLFFLSLFASGLYLAVQPGAAWLERLPDVIVQAKDKLAGVREAVDQMQDVSEQVGELTQLDEEEADESVTVEGPTFGQSLASFLRTFLVQILFTAVLTYFFLAARRDLRRKVILLNRDFRGMRRTARMLDAVEKKVGAYMLTMVIINIGLGLATAGAMAGIGMPSPLIWGGLAAILNFVPYLGPIVLTLLLAVTGLVTYDTIPSMLAPAGIYIALNFIESNFVTPMLLGVRLTISPLAVILNLSFWTWLWGPAGAVVSIPMLVIFKTICDHSVVLRPVGLLIGGSDTVLAMKRRRQARRRVMTSAY